MILNVSVGTGAMKTIVPPGVVGGRRLFSTTWRLRIATGAAANVYGMIDVIFAIVSNRKTLGVLVADRGKCHLGGGPHKQL